MVLLSILALIGFGGIMPHTGCGERIGYMLELDKLGDDVYPGGPGGPK